MNFSPSSRNNLFTFRFPVTVCAAFWHVEHTYSDSYHVYVHFSLLYISLWYAHCHFWIIHVIFSNEHRNMNGNFISVPFNWTKKKNEIVLPFYEYVIIRYTEAKLILCIAQIDGLICNGIYIGNYSISRNSAYVLCNVKRPCISSSSQSVVIAISSYIYSTTRIKCSISVLWYTLGQRRWQY